MTVIFQVIRVSLLLFFIIPQLFIVLFINISDTRERGYVHRLHKKKAGLEQRRLEDDIIINILEEGSVKNREESSFYNFNWYLFFLASFHSSNH